MGVGRGTVSFLHQPDSDTCLSSPDNKPPNDTSGEDSTSPTNKSSPTSLLSSRVSTPDWLGGWARPVRARVGGWPAPARAAQPTRHLGKPQSSVPGTERSCPSSCTIYKYSDHRKRDVSEGTVHCALLSRVAQPLGVVATKGVQTGGPGVRVAPRQSRELRAPCCRLGQALRVGSAW